MKNRKVIATKAFQIIQSELFEFMISHPDPKMRQIVAQWLMDNHYVEIALTMKTDIDPGVKIILIRGLGQLKQGEPLLDFVFDEDLSVKWALIINATITEQFELLEMLNEDPDERIRRNALKSLIISEKKELLPSFFNDPLPEIKQLAYLGFMEIDPSELKESNIQQLKHSLSPEKLECLVPLLESIGNVKLLKELTYDADAKPELSLAAEEAINRIGFKI
jgi:hypothetical protein